MKLKYFFLIIIVNFTFFTFPACSKSTDNNVRITSDSTYLYQWSKISTDQTDSATITSPHSSTTTVTGLKQGMWYYQLTTTKGVVTNYDTVVVRVDYDMPPANSILLAELPIAAIAHVANLRDDTTIYWAYDATHSQYYDAANQHKANYIFLERSRLNGMHVDSAKGKFYSTVEDGYKWNNDDYARSELTYGLQFGLDSNKIYIIGWKGYFPQDFDNITPGKDVTVIFQLHGADDYSPPFQFTAKDGALWWIECIAPSNARTVTQKVANYSDFYNQTHTIRIIIKEGLAGSGAYKS